MGDSRGTNYKKYSGANSREYGEVENRAYMWGKQKSKCSNSTT